MVQVVHADYWFGVFVVSEGEITAIYVFFVRFVLETHDFDSDEVELCLNAAGAGRMGVFRITNE